MDTIMAADIGRGHRHGQKTWNGTFTTLQKLYKSISTHANAVDWLRWLLPKRARQRSCGRLAPLVRGKKGLGTAGLELNKLRARGDVIALSSPA